MNNILNNINYKNETMNWKLRFTLYVVLGLGFNFLFSFMLLIPFIFLEIMASELSSMFFLNPTSTYIIDALISLMFTLSSIVILLLFEKGSLKKRLGFEKGNVLKKYSIGYLIGTVLIVFSALPIIVFYTSEYTINSDASFVFIIIGFIFFLIQGASEEVFVRGLIFPVLVKESRPIIAIIFTSLFFSLLHLTNPHFSIISFVNLTLSGVLFGYCVIYFDSLWQACALHSAWNFVQCYILGFPVSGYVQPDSAIFKSTLSGNPLYTGGDFGVEGSAFLIVVLTLAIIIFHLLCVKKGINIFAKTKSLV